jgi:protein-disulfide isomerase
MNQYLTREEIKRKRTKRISLWAGSVALVALSVWGVIALNQASQGSVLGEQISGTDMIFGNPNGIIELVEYSDFQCPACAAESPKVNQLLVDYKDQIKFVYRHFPLKSIHPNAEPAAKAAEAAGVQGKFMEMGDLLFKNQSSWASSPNPTGLFVDYATQLGLDMDKFQKDMRSDDIRTKINREYQSGIDAGVNSTPTFFLNGEKITNPATYEGFKQLIEEAINEKQ